MIVHVQTVNTWLLPRSQIWGYCHVQPYHS